MLHAAFVDFIVCVCFFSGMTSLNTQSVHNVCPTKARWNPIGLLFSKECKIDNRGQPALLNSLKTSAAYKRQYDCHHWFRDIVNSSARNKFRWNIYQNSYIFIQAYAFKMSSAKCRPFCFGLNVLKIILMREIPLERLFSIYTIGCFMKDFHMGLSESIQFQW